MSSSRPSDSKSSTYNAPLLPTVTLPKGGGALTSMGEKFSANPVTGTASASIPIPITPARGLEPSLGLSYDGGAGNSAFGFGWSLSVSHISRKTSRGLPLYDDRLESDEFILSGLEDLVPVLAADGSKVEDRKALPGYVVRGYRPRIEGSFSRIERCTKESDEMDVHWRVLTSDNLLTIFGSDSESRISNVEAAGEIFTWLISEIRDQKGNVVWYRYKSEDGKGVDLAAPHQRNRGTVEDPRRGTNRYLKWVYYGNQLPLLDGEGQRPLFLEKTTLANTKWMFEVVFDYGEHDDLNPLPSDPGDWSYRPDAFSSFRSGFEIRTNRLCKRILMFHHFPGEADVGSDCLVRSTDLKHAFGGEMKWATYSYLESATQRGYRKAGGRYIMRETPPVEFEYSQPHMSDIIEVAPEAAVENLGNLAAPNTRWIDLYGEGMAGILVQEDEAWYYKRNVSPLKEVTTNGTTHIEMMLGPLEVVSQRPSANKVVQFRDLTGGGLQSALAEHDFVWAFFSSDGQERWQNLTEFIAKVNFNLQSPLVRFMDVDGDGLPEVVVASEEGFQWYRWDDSGFSWSGTVAGGPLDEELGPRILFSDRYELFELADFTGDGLQDIVRICNGEVSYWPSRGYGRFGAKVTLDRSPYFDTDDQFDVKRILLTDIDGTGTVDIIYLHRDGPRVYFNQSGNGLSSANPLANIGSLDGPDGLVSVTAADVLGDGTACLVFSSSHLFETRQPLLYSRLMTEKPHLLKRVSNNMGAVTEIHYAPSTKFYLKDKQDGIPWATRLPFPVHVVESVVTMDLISRNTFVSRFAYHHGHYDGPEREFRGFGMVEQWDSEIFTALSARARSGAMENINAETHLPPVHIKTWFHTGAYIDEERIARAFDKEYYADAQVTWTLPDTTLLPGTGLLDKRDAYRALKGRILRSEVYTDDYVPGGSEASLVRSKIPHSVTETSYSLRLVQSKLSNRSAVFLPTKAESLSFILDRNPADPRIAHTIVLQTNEYGQVLQEVSIGYGRRNADPDLETEWDKNNQTKTSVIYVETGVTGAINTPLTHRLPTSCETKTFELTGFNPTSPTKPFSTNDFADAPDLEALPYDSVTDGRTKQKRILKWGRTLFRKDDLSALLPLYEIEPLAISGECYQAAFTESMINTYLSKNGQPLLPNLDSLLTGTSPNDGGYVKGMGALFPPSDPQDLYWVPSGRLYLSTATDATQELQDARSAFFIPRRLRTVFGAESTVTYDGYHLLLVESADAIGNKMTVGERDVQGNRASNGNDYRTLRPRMVTDMNGNESFVRFDPMGAVVARAIAGKHGSGEGDSLDGIDLEPSSTAVLNFIAAPTTPPDALLGDATVRILYDDFAYMRTKHTASPLPSVVCTIERVTQPSETGEGEDSVQEPVVGLVYSDGFQRVVQSKARVKDGPLPKRDAEGRMIIEDGVPQMTERDAGPRWVTEGWTIHNNKGKAVRQYEPFFTDRPGFEFDVRVGVSPISFFDYAERAVAVLTPEDSYVKTQYGPWKDITFDASDTVKSDPRTDADVAPYAAAYFAAHPDFQTWYQKRMAKPPGDFDRKAAEKTAAAHHDTPSTQFLDNLGRVFLTVAQNKVVCAGHDQDGSERRLSSRVELDIEGNSLAMRDADRQGADPRGRIVAETRYTMLGAAVHSRSMEKGDRWILNNVVGLPIRSWDSRGHMLRSEYDAVGRAVGTFLSTSGGDQDSGNEKLVTRVVHGDYHPDAATLNLRGAIYLTLEQAGAAYIERVDWRGNTRETKQRIAKEYRDVVDWKVMESVLPSKLTDVLDTNVVEQALAAVVEPEIYRANATFDSLGRQVIVTSAHANDSKPSRTRFTYVHSQLETISCNIRDERGDDGGLFWTPLVTRFDHDAKGQRKQLDYGNKVSTTYTYDAFFHLTNMLTQRHGGPTSNNTLQDISYTYDCTGDITAVQDAAKQTQFFRNQIIRPVNEYVYSALHELVRASGREHLGQNNGAPNPYKDNDKSRFDKALPNSEVAMGGYTEFYSYDDARNMSRMRHKSDDNPSRDWTRGFEYQVSSRIEPAKKSNCLSASSVAGAREEFMTDEHGNTTRMPHLGLSPGQENMAWDYEDRLKRLDLGGGGIAYYCYGDSGSRTRKVVERAENLIEERIYLGEIEIYRKRNTSGVLIERETLHVHDDQRRIALIESRSEGSAQDRAPLRLIRYQLSDHLGSSSLEMDADAQLLTLEEYAPYGSTTYQASTANLETPKRYRFTGKERDEESGLSYHGARYLAPWLGRWTAGDPGGTRDGTNMYRYVRGNPIRLTDPSGLEGDVWQPLNIDEIRAPKGDGAKAAEQMWRASAAGNRQFYNRNLNIAKGRGTHAGLVEEPAPTEEQLIKLDERPEALVEENFGKIKETKELIEKWVAENPPKPGEDANLYRDKLNKFLKATFKRLLRENADPIGRALNKLGVRINKEGGYLEWNGKTPHSNPLEPPEHVRNPPKKVRVKGGGGGGSSNGAAPDAPPPPTPEAVPAPAPQPAVEPHVAVRPPKEVVDVILKPTEAPPGALQGRLIPTAKMANTVMGGLMYGGMAGAALRDIDQGHVGQAAFMAGVNGALIFAAKRNPWVGAAMVAYGTVENWDSDLAKEQGAAANSWVTEKLGSKTAGTVAGAIAQGGTALGKALVIDQWNDIKDGVKVIGKWTGGW